MQAPRIVPCLLVAAALVSGNVLAQATPPAPAPAAATGAGTGSSMVPWSGRGYLGLNVGRSRFAAPCGAAAFGCDNAATSASLYAGSMVNNFWGVELGYIDMGRMDRGGGTTKAQGLNLSLVGKVPVAQSFGVFGKVGTTYGRTETSAAAASGLATGNDHGFGLSYGAGVSYDFTPRLSGIVSWESHDFRFAGSGRDAVRSTSLGLQYKY
jgi:OOP family OmpA-OmpF porin